MIGNVLCLVSSLVLVFSAELEPVKYDNLLSRGFGDDINWIPWDEAREEAAKTDKPIFLLIHKSWCHACKSLQHKFQQTSAQKQFKELSQYFIMSNTEDNDEPWEEEFQPDGKYVPRLLFLDPSGELMKNIVNEKSEYADFKYYYDNPARVFASMQKVAQVYGARFPAKKKPAAQKAAPDAKTGSEEAKEKKEDGQMKAEKKHGATPPAAEPPASGTPPAASPPADLPADKASKKDQMKKDQEKKVKKEL